MKLLQHQTAALRFERGEASLLEWAHAVAQADPAQRAEVVRQAAGLFAADPDIEQQVAGVVREFFARDRLPSADTAPDGPENGANPNAPAGYPAPGQDADDEDSDAKAGPLPRQDETGRRTLPEVEAAAELLAALARRVWRLQDPVARAGLGVRLAAMRSRDRSLRGALTRVADELADAARAAGTDTGLQMSRTEELVEAAVARGAGIDEADLVATFSQEWNVLARRGLARVDRERYVELNLKRREQH